MSGPCPGHRTMCSCVIELLAGGRLFPPGAVLRGSLHQILYRIWSRRCQVHTKAGKQKANVRSDIKGKGVLTSDGWIILFIALLLNMAIGLDWTKLMAPGQIAV
ncbi:hypothetical protein CLCR_00725 [Cladophialophora carrionii]|uniref:Uncharacterized protein n=1 Tax=Cladophialophora carrionii TaxID=86049 RepID=A0A1C1C6M7_9EURO|nr:hypothetical protein CLCR_00725 [Cladophialophora carrionii]